MVVVGGAGGVDGDVVVFWRGDVGGWRLLLLLLLLLFWGRGRKDDGNSVMGNLVKVGFSGLDVIAWGEPGLNKFISGCFDTGLHFRRECPHISSP